MNKATIIRVLLFFDILWVAVLTDDYAPECPYKQCSCGAKVILCSELKLDAMPTLTVPNNTFFVSADFDINNISVVTAGSLPANLTGISFVKNPITTIDDDAFIGSANTLTSLTFFQARFIQLPAAFGRLNVLSFLSISESSIVDWDLDALKSISSSLQTLSLETLTFKQWPSWLQYFTNLTDLNINGCLISSIPDNGLDTQINTLTYISLNNNSLPTVPKAISKLNALKALGLATNKISDVKWLPPNSKLESLSLNGNKLRDAGQLSDAIRPYASTMSGFYIQNNLLTSFPVFDFLTQVTSFDFNHNKLVDPNSGSLPANLSQLKMKGNELPRIPRFLSSLTKITQVYLGSNAITDLEGTAFPPFSAGVELENNLITEITDTSFPFNSSITYVLLNNNPLVKISDNAFLNLPQLVDLNLQYTKLTRLPLALTTLKKIDNFDISNTPTLVCTCVEKSIQDWFTLMAREMIKGTCGRTTVLYFYTVLSPSCP